MSVQIGKPKFGGNFVKRTYWKLKDGESVFRILPPIGKEACETGRWSHFWNVHYGYRNSKGEMRVFQSPLVKNRKTKMVEVTDAALERIDTLKAELEKAKAAGNKQAVDVLMELVGGQKAKYNLDNNHYVNAMDEQGNIGILKLRHRAKLALDATIKTLRSNGVEPLDATTGRFFVFNRSGSGLETTFQVTVKQNKRVIDGVGTVYQDVVHTLTPDIIERLGREAAALDKLYKSPSSEEVARIVKDSDLQTGKSRAVDEILDTKNDDIQSDDDGNDTEQTSTQVTETTQQTTTVQQVFTQAPTTQPVQAPAQQLPVAAAPAHKVAAPTSIVAPAKTTAQSVSEQSDQEFLKSLGL